MILVHNMEEDEFVKHFQHLGKALSYICCFTYKREHCKRAVCHHSYKWSKSMFALNLFVHFICYIFTYCNFFKNFQVEINNLTKFIVCSAYAGLRFALAFLEQDPFTNLISEIQIYDVKKKILFHQHRSLHKQQYGKLVVYALTFILIFVLFYYIVGVMFSYTNTNTSDRVILLTAIVVLNLPSLPFTVLFVYFAYEIFVRYKSLHKYFLNELNFVNENCNEKFLDDYRLLFFQLSKVQYKFNICFGSGTSIFYCFSYFIMLCSMRDALVVYHHPLILFLIMKVIFEVYLIANFAGNIPQEVNLL